MIFHGARLHSAIDIDIVLFVILYDNYLRHVGWLRHLYNVYIGNAYDMYTPLNKLFASFLQASRPFYFTIRATHSLA